MAEPAVGLLDEDAALGAPAAWHAVAGGAVAYPRFHTEEERGAEGCLEGKLDGGVGLLGEVAVCDPTKSGSIAKSFETNIQEQIYLESKTWYRRYGVSERPMPADFFRAAKVASA